MSFHPPLTIGSHAEYRREDYFFARQQNGHVPLERSGPPLKSYFQANDIAALVGIVGLASAWTFIAAVFS